MSDALAPAERAERYLAERATYQLGELVTERPHPRTADLGEAARRDPAAALRTLFDVDRDVVDAYERWMPAGVLPLASAVRHALDLGGRVFFTGCGATGRLAIQLDAAWRRLGPPWADRTVSVMAGGDFALVRSVEGFEDHAAFGRRQLAEAGVGPRDVVFAITEGGETPFVIGTAWQAVEAGARCFFVYCNPDDVLRRTVTRSREVLDDPRITKVNLTTGPMAVTGSTRMQATSVQLAAMLTALEQALDAPGDVPIGAVRAALASSADDLAALVRLEADRYRAGGRVTYFADRLAMDVLTDTTERSPTYAVPAFARFDDPEAAPPWASLFVPAERTDDAWRRVLGRPLRTVSWDRDAVRALVRDDDVERVHGIVRRIGDGDVLRFRIGLDGLPYRRIGEGDAAVAVVAGEEVDGLDAGGFFRTRLAEAHARGAALAVVVLGGSQEIARARQLLDAWGGPATRVLVALPPGGPLDAPLRLGAKMLLNALSTCAMARLGRVWGNVMVWVVPTNGKLIDRATRYVQQLTGMGYDEACRAVFEALAYVEPRMQAGRAFPPPVALAVLRARNGGGFEEAERVLEEEGA